jgi:hypothetical protein
VGEREIVKERDRGESERKKHTKSRSRPFTLVGVTKHISHKRPHFSNAAIPPICYGISIINYRSFSRPRRGRIRRARGEEGEGRRILLCFDSI